MLCICQGKPLLCEVSIILIAVSASGGARIPRAAVALIIVRVRSAASGAQLQTQPQSQEHNREIMDCFVFHKMCLRCLAEMLAREKTIVHNPQYMILTLCSANMYTCLDLLGMIARCCPLAQTCLDFPNYSCQAGFLSATCLPGLAWACLGLAALSFLGPPLGSTHRYHLRENICCQNARPNNAAPASRPSKRIHHSTPTSTPPTPNPATRSLAPTSSTIKPN